MQKIEQVFIFVSQDQELANRDTPITHSSEVLPIDLSEIRKITERFRIPKKGDFDLLNLFFHHLPSGAYAIGRLVPALDENPKKSGKKSYYLHYMIVSSKTFLRFGNNPVFLYQEILTSGQLPFITKPEEKIEPIFLNRPRKWFDIPLLKGMSAYPGAVPIAKLADAVLHSMNTIVAGGQESLYVISALFNIFPIRLRPELTFSSGIFSMQNRNFRIIGTSKKNLSSTAICKHSPISILDLDKLALHAEKLELHHGWEKYICEVLQSKTFELFQTRLVSYDKDYAREIREEIPAVPSAFQLDQLGMEWLEMLKQRNSSAPSHYSKEKAGPKDRIPSKFPKENKEKVFRLRRTETPVQPSIHISEKLRRWLLSDNPEDAPLYFREQKPARPRFHSPLLLRTGKSSIFSPYQRLLAVYPNEEDVLRHLDQLVTSVLNNDPETLDQLTQYWTQLIAHIDEEHKWRISEEYIHFIKINITETENPGEIDVPNQSLLALDLLNLFLNEGESAEFSFDAD